jgi:transcriptional regulator with XRE-family HTH domain
MNAFGPVIVTSAQIRAARALLRITGVQLAEAAHVNVSTIRRFEDDGEGSQLSKRAMKRALEEMGIEFVELRGVQLKD